MSSVVEEAMTQVAACPLRIMAERHFVQSGTECRCTDPYHFEMAEWGYQWDGARWERRAQE